MSNSSCSFTSPSIRLSRAWLTRWQWEYVLSIETSRLRLVSLDKLLIQERPAKPLVLCWMTGLPLKQSEVHKWSFACIFITTNFFNILQTCQFFCWQVVDCKVLLSGGTWKKNDVRMCDPGFHNHTLGYEDWGPKLYPFLQKIGQNHTFDNRKYHENNYFDANLYEIGQIWPKSCHLVWKKVRVCPNGQGLLKIYPWLWNLSQN